MREVLAAMARPLMAMDRPVVHDDEPGAAEAAFRGHHTGFQSGGRRDDLESGSRLICIIDAAVSPDAVQDILGLLPGDIFRRALRQLVRVVQIELRHIDHGQDLAVLGIHHQDGHAVRLLCGHGLVRQLRRVGLDVHVQADAEVLAAHRLQPTFPRGFHFDALRVRHGQYLAGLPLQVLIVDHLQADDSLVVPAGEAQHLAGQLIVRIISLVILVYLHPRKVILPDPVSQLLIHIALDPLHGRVFFHTLSHIVFRELQFPAQDFDDLFRVLQLIMYDGYRADRPVVCQHGAVAVQDTASGRFYAALPLMQGRGQRGIVLRPPDAQIHEPSEQEQEDACADEKNRQYLLPVEYFVVVRQHTNLMKGC